jgi:hypothetical protein
MANLGHRLSETVGNILRRHGLSPAPLRKQVICWRDFIRAHREVLVGTDFFTVEVLTRELIESGSVETIRLPARSPNLKAFAERWVRSVKEECLSRLILFGESSLRRALQQSVVHYHEERNHQGKENLILFPTQTEARKKKAGAVRCRERLAGLLKYYEPEAA